MPPGGRGNRPAGGAAGGAVRDVAGPVTGFGAAYFRLHLRPPFLPSG